MHPRLWFYTIFVIFSLFLRTTSRRVTRFPKSAGFLFYRTNTINERPCRMVTPSSYSCCETVNFVHCAGQKMLCSNLMFETDGLHVNISLDNTILKSRLITNYQPFTICSSIPGSFFSKICARIVELNQFPRSLTACVRHEIKTKFQEWRINYTCVSISTENDTMVMAELMSPTTSRQLPMTSMMTSKPDTGPEPSPEPQPAPETESPPPSGESGPSGGESEPTGDYELTGGDLGLSANLAANSNKNKVSTTTSRTVKKKKVRVRKTHRQKQGRGIVNDERDPQIDWHVVSQSTSKNDEPKLVNPHSPSQNFSPVTGVFVEHAYQQAPQTHAFEAFKHTEKIDDYFDSGGNGSTKHFPERIPPGIAKLLEIESKSLFDAPRLNTTAETTPDILIFPD